MTEKVLRHRGEMDREPLHYTSCGLDDVYLMSGYERVQTDHGPGLTIKNMGDLHRAIGLHLVQEKKALCGKEVRFLRKQMDLTQDELGDILNVSGQSVARWEKGETEIPGPADLLIRVVYGQHVGNQLDVRQLHEELKARDDAGTDVRFALNRTGWHLAA